MSLSSLSAAVSSPTPAIVGTAQQEQLNLQQTLPQSPTPVPITSYTPTPVNSGNPPTYAIAVAPGTSVRVPIWEHDPSDPVSQIMARNFLSSSQPSPFAGLGAALLARFKTDPSDFSQSVVMPPPPGQAGAIGATGGGNSGGAGDIVLNVTTDTGTKVEVEIHSHGDLAVQIKVNGSLTNAEQLALASLAQGFQSAIDGFTAAKPSIDVSGLLQFDPTVLSSVDLSLQFPSISEGKPTLDFQADSTHRSINVNLPQGVVNISMNMANSSIIGTTQAQQDKAVSNYLQQFTEAKSRDQGEDPVLMAMFADSFTQINSHYPPPSLSSFAVAPSVRTDQDHAMLTGLADFQASVTQTPTSPNPLKLGEVDHFSYQLSQQTTLSGQDYGDRVITQQQQSSLSASYHKSLQPGIPLMLTTDKKSQNYYYEQIEDNASATATIGYKNKLLEQASISKSASQSTHETKFVLGNKVEDITTPVSMSVTEDLMSILAPFQSGDPKDADQWKKVLAEINNQVFLQSDPNQL